MNKTLTTGYLLTPSSPRLPQATRRRSARLLRIALRDRSGDRSGSVHWFDLKSRSAALASTRHRHPIEPPLPDKEAPPLPSPSRCHHYRRHRRCRLVSLSRRLAGRPVRGYRLERHLSTYPSLETCSRPAAQSTVLRPGLRQGHSSGAAPESPRKRKCVSGLGTPGGGTRGRRRRRRQRRRR